MFSHILERIKKKLTFNSTTDMSQVNAVWSLNEVVAPRASGMRSKTTRKDLPNIFSIWKDRLERPERQLAK